MYGEIIHEFIDRTGGRTMLCLTCSMISSVDLARYGDRAKMNLINFISGRIRCDPL